MNSIVRQEKVVSALPAQLQPNTHYFVRVGSGFDHYLSDSTGNVAHKLNGAEQAHTHAIADTTGLQGALDAKLAATANAVSASKLSTTRSISLSGDVTGSVNFDGTANVTITATVADDSHNHIIANVDGLQTALDGKLSTTAKAADADKLDGIDSEGFFLRRPRNGDDLNTMLQGAYGLNTNNPNLPAGLGNGAVAAFYPSSGDTGFQIASAYAGADLHFRGFRNYGAAFAPWRKIWNEGNDGAGSGLDADLVDGYQATDLLNIANATGTIPNARFSTDASFYKFDPGIAASNIRHNTLDAPTIGEAAIESSYVENKFLFAVPNIVEVSTDNEATYTPHVFAASDLKRFVMGRAGGGGQLSTNRAWTQLRLQWDAASFPNGYVYLNYLYLYHSGNGNSFTVKIERKYNDDNTWYTVMESPSAGSWPGHSWIPHSTIPFTASNGRNNAVRVTFTLTHSHATNSIHFYRLNWHGTYPAAEGGRIYSWNEDGVINLVKSGATVGNQVIWHAGNDGAGSGLDADMVDGIHASQLTHATNHTYTDPNLMTARSEVSSIYATSNSPFGAGWYNLVNIRHRGGEGDGNRYGGQIATGMTAFTDRMAFRNHNNDSWGIWKEVFTDAYHPNADKLTTPRTITLGGDATGSVSFDGSANVTLTATVTNADTVDGKHASAFALTSQLPISPASYGAVGDGVTDDTTAIQAMVDALILSNNRQTSYANAAPRVIDLGGKTYVLTKPIILGSTTTVTRVLQHVQFQNGRFKAAGTTGWVGNVDTNVPAQFMFVLIDDPAAGYVYETNIGTYRVGFENVQLHCDYRTGGIFFRNTDSCYLHRVRVDALGKNCKGIHSIERNGALMIEDCFVQGYEETSGLTYPNGEDQDTMNTTALQIESNDGRINNFICSKVTKSIHVDNCGAVQFNNIHPWAKLVYIGPNAKRTMWSNVYFDWTTIHLDGSFKHFFTGCHLLLGGTERWLRLTARNANETGGDLRFSGYINGQQWQATGGILHDTSGAGTWAADKDRTYTLDITTEVEGRANVPVPFRVSDFMWIENTGKTHFQNTDRTKGRATLTGNNMFLGNGRSTDGYTSATLYSKADATDGAIIEAFTTGYATFGSIGGSVEMLGAGESYLSLRVDEGLVKSRRPFHVTSLDPTAGQSWLSTNVLSLGAARTADGYAGIALVSGVNDTKKTIIETYGATGNFVINAGGEFNFDVKGGRYLKSDSARSTLVSVARLEAPEFVVTDADATKGDSKLTGNVLTLGEYRTTDGLSAIYFTHNTAGQSASIETYASGQTQISSPADFKVHIGGLEYLRIFHDASVSANRRAYFPYRTRVGTPTATDDATTKAYVDAAVAGAGGGSWVGSATSALDMNNWDIIDAKSLTTNGAINVGAYATHSAGGSFGGNLTMGANRITDVGSPVNAGDVTTKSWVEAINVVAGNGMTGGGTLASGGTTITMGTPASITNTSTNSVTSTSHTHDLPSASVLALIAEGSNSAVGTYSFLSAKGTSTSYSAGSTYAGSGLQHVGLNSATIGSGSPTLTNGAVTTSPAGTWRAMGRTGSSAYSATLFLRIS